MRTFRGCAAALALSIFSTPKGVLAGHEAWREHVGGEVLCYIW